MLQISRGLDLPIDGTPEQKIGMAPHLSHVGLVGEDYPGLKPQLKVALGQAIARGETLFTDRLTGVKYTAPLGGVVEQINRGPKRSLKSVVIRVEGSSTKTFPSYSRAELATIAPGDIKQQLLDCGLWTAFRTRPYCRNPDPKSAPHSIFVTAIDTHPLASDPAIAIAAFPQDFADGLTLLSRMFDVDVYVCSASGQAIQLPAEKNIKDVKFSGCHPAGLVGTHIHFLDPVGEQKSVWHLGYQDVIAIGQTFKQGILSNSRIVALAGPPVSRPRLLRMSLGSKLSDIAAGEMPAGDYRVISGSVLSGRATAFGEGFLGRYHHQISVLDEAPTTMGVTASEPMRRFSCYGAIDRWLMRAKSFRFDTALNGAVRPIFSFGMFERMMPLDILATPLLRTLMTGDVDAAIELGCLELAEEDLALCEFVCCSKNEYGAALRSCLDAIHARQREAQAS